MVVLHGLSRHTSCSVLVSTLLHSDTLSDVDKLSTELTAEDMNCQAAPAMYGLAADAEGVLPCIRCACTSHCCCSVHHDEQQVLSPPRSQVGGLLATRHRLRHGRQTRLRAQVRLLQRQPLDGRLLQEADR